MDNERVTETAKRIVNKVMTAPYIYIGGPLCGLVLGVMGSNTMNNISQTIRPDLDRLDFGPTFGQRFLNGYRSVRNAFRYEPSKEKPSDLEENI